jgi:small-conductance mechanosensitive channel
MNQKEKSELEALKGEKDIQRALKGSRRRRKGIKVIASAKDKISILTYVLILFGLAGFRYVLKIGTFLNLDFVNNFLPEQLQLSDKLIEGAMTVVLILLLTKFINVFFINGIEDPASKFNLKRVLNLVIGIVLFFLIISILFANWYTAVVSLGLISLILGFALQTPITSFIAWIHIIITRPYKVGDRIKIGEAAGDVIDIGYLETTLWETVGSDMASEHPSGRIIRFPNSNILSNAVFNYSWALFPYIWDEVSVFVGFRTDLNFLSRIMSDIVLKEMGEDFSHKIKMYHEVLKETTVDEKRVKDKPEVFFRTHENMWIEAKVRYVVVPREAGELKSRIMEILLREIRNNPDKIQLPEDAER